MSLKKLLHVRAGALPSVASQKKIACSLTGQRKSICRVYSCICDKKAPAAINFESSRFLHRALRYCRNYNFVERPITKPFVNKEHGVSMVAAAFFTHGRESQRCKACHAKIVCFKMIAGIIKFCFFCGTVPTKPCAVGRDVSPYMTINDGLCHTFNLIFLCNINLKGTSARAFQVFKFFSTPCNSVYRSPHLNRCHSSSDICRGDCFIPLLLLMNSKILVPSPYTFSRRYHSNSVVRQKAYKSRQGNV